MATKKVLTGVRSPHTRLWVLSIDKHHQSQPTYPFAAPVIKNQNQAQLVAFYHAILGSPAIASMLEAVKKNFLPFPLLTAEMIRRNQPNSIATHEGHLDQ